MTEKELIFTLAYNAHAWNIIAIQHADISRGRSSSDDQPLYALKWLAADVIDKIVSCINIIHILH